MEIVFGLVKEDVLYSCSGYNNDCWCNNVACQGQND